MSDWLDYALAVVMIACAIFVIMKPCTNVTINQGIGGAMCVAEYDYRVNNVCLYYSNYTYVYAIVEDNDTHLDNGSLTAFKKETHDYSFPK